jgi:dimethylhistidine N-methyltransferase
MSHSVATLPIAPKAAFRNDVLHGLGHDPKWLPCKYFYDAQGADLFDRICHLEAYYPTRTELAIMRCHVREMASLIGRRARLVELGSGSSTKTRILLDHAQELDAYVPVDISREYLARATEGLIRDYPHLSVVPVCADYSRPFTLPETRRSVRTVVYFPGSTIGNFQPAEAKQFLKVIAGLCHGGGGLLIGVDLKKDRRILDVAYNDPEGVTAAFNLNLLARINRELDGDFDLGAFHHRAFYDAGEGRIEMQLVSASRQLVRVGRSIFSFAEGEAICTEYSYKYSIEDFAKLAVSAGWVVRRVWTDERSLFSVQYLAPSP